MKNNYFIRTRSFLSVAICLFSFSANSQSDYTVSAIPHQLYFANTAVEYSEDDVYSAIIPLTFDFTYFGNTYNQVVIGTNGVIQFDTSLANMHNPWPINTPIPNTNFNVKNAVLGCYHDMFNTMALSTGSINKAVVGSAPYRKFIVIFNNQPAYSCGSDAMTSFQMILYETLNTIDVQIVEREVCPTWNNGNAVIGLINAAGDTAFTPPARNTGQWTANQEGWRFSLPQNMLAYNYTMCDSDLNGTENFNLQVVRTDLNNENLQFYETASDAQTASNALPSLTYTNTTNQQSIYATDGTLTFEIILRAIDCATDYDLDTVPTATEDLNGDGNLANDDTDGDGIPNFMDNDDDGDMVLTSVEYVFPSNSTDKSVQTLLDTDGDGIPNYLDNDDDGDGILTIDEDANGNNNPADDDENENGIPDYLESALLSTVQNSIDSLISLYPNPASDVFYINNKSEQSISQILIYSINGVLVKDIKNAADTTAINVSDLKTGIYFVKIIVGESLINYKLIKK